MAKRTLSEGRPGPEWFDRREMAGLIGVALSHFDSHWRNRLGDADVVKRGRHVWLRGRAVVDLYVNQQLAKAGGGSGDDADELLMAAGGGTSPALEEYRRWKARKARIDTLEAEGTMVRADVNHAALAQLASLIRGAGEVLQRQFGQEAQDILDGALNEYEREVVDAAGADGV